MKTNGNRMHSVKVIALLLIAAFVCCALCACLGGADKPNEKAEADEQQEEIKKPPKPEDLTFGRAYLDELDLPGWDGTAASSFSGGTGTPDDPYVICSGGELLLLANHCRDGIEQDAYYCLGSDILLNRFSDPEEVYAAGEDFGGHVMPGIRDFRGNFNGLGHIIYGLVSPSGLFENTESGAVIYNLNLELAVVGVGGAYSNYGGIVGQAHNKLSMIGCTFNGIVRADNACVGGIVGCVKIDDGSRASIGCCCNFGKVDGGEQGTAGGIVGYMYLNQNSSNTNRGYMHGCMSTGFVKGATVGGILGGATLTGSRTGSNVRLDNCYNYGDTILGDEASSRGIGGIIGVADPDYGYSITAAGCADLVIHDDVYAIVGSDELQYGSELALYHCCSRGGELYPEALNGNSGFTQQECKRLTDDQLQENYLSAYAGVRRAVEEESWLAYGESIYYTSCGMIFRADRDGSREQVLGTLYTGEDEFVPTSWLADDDYIFFIVYDYDENTYDYNLRLMARSLIDGSESEIDRGINDLGALQDGCLYYTRYSDATEFCRYREGDAAPEVIFDRTMTVTDKYFIGTKYTDGTVTYYFYKLDCSFVREHSFREAGYTESDYCVGIAGNHLYVLENGAIMEYDPMEDTLMEVCKYSGEGFNCFEREDEDYIYVTRNLTYEEWEANGYAYNCSRYRIDKKTGESELVGNFFVS